MSFKILRSLNSAFQPVFVDEDAFLKAAIEDKLPVIEKYLADGGDPNVCDHVSFVCLHYVVDWKRHCLQ